MDLVVAALTPPSFGVEMRKIWGQSTKGVEIIFSGFTAGWGIAIVNPSSHVFETSPAYSTLANLLPQQAWGVIAISIALMRVIGAVYHRYPLRLTAATLGCVLWSLVATGIYRSDPHSPGLWIFGWYTMVCFFLIVRLLWGRGAGES